MSFSSSFTTMSLSVLQNRSESDQSITQHSGCYNPSCEGRYSSAIVSISENSDAESHSVNNEPLLENIKDFARSKRATRFTPEDGRTYDRLNSIRTPDIIRPCGVPILLVPGSYHVPWFCFDDGSPMRVVAYRTERELFTGLPSMWHCCLASFLPGTHFYLDDLETEFCSYIVKQNVEVIERIVALSAPYLGPITVADACHNYFRDGPAHLFRTEGLIRSVWEWAYAKLISKVDEGQLDQQLTDLAASAAKGVYRGAEARFLTQMTANNFGELSMLDQAELASAFALCFLALSKVRKSYQAAVIAIALTRHVKVVKAFNTHQRSFLILCLLTLWKLSVRIKDSVDDGVDEYVAESSVSIKSMLQKLGIYPEGFPEVDQKASEFSEIWTQLLTAGRYATALTAIWRASELICGLLRSYVSESDTNETDITYAQTFLDRNVSDLETFSPRDVCTMGDLAFRLKRKLAVNMLTNSQKEIALRLVNLSERWNMRVIASKNQPAPFCVFLSGDTGVGKSTLMQVVPKLIWELMHSSDDPYSALEHFNWDLGEYFEGYSGNRIWITDDSNPMEDPERASTMLTNFLRITGDVHQPLNMAEAHSKGRFYAFVDQFWYLANSDVPTGFLKAPLTREAVSRRFSSKWRVTWAECEEKVFKPDYSHACFQRVTFDCSSGRAKVESTTDFKGFLRGLLLDAEITMDKRGDRPQNIEAVEQFARSVLDSNDSISSLSDHPVFEFDDLYRVTPQPQAVWAAEARSEFVSSDGETSVDLDSALRSYERRYWVSRLRQICFFKLTPLDHRVLALNQHRNSAFVTWAARSLLFFGACSAAVQLGLMGGKLFLGGDDEEDFASESLPEKKTRRHYNKRAEFHGSRVVTVEYSPESGAESVKPPIQLMKNFVKLRAIGKDCTRTVHGVLCSNDEILTVSHFVCELRDLGEFQLKVTNLSEGTPYSGVVTSFDTANESLLVTEMNDHDVALLKLPTKLPGVKKTGKFLIDSPHDLPGPHFVGYYHGVEVSSPLTITHVEASGHGYTYSNQAVSFTNSLLYPLTEGPSSCGSLLCLGNRLIGLHSAGAKNSGSARLVTSVILAELRQRGFKSLNSKGFPDPTMVVRAELKRLGEPVVHSGPYGFPHTVTRLVKNTGLSKHFPAKEFASDPNIKSTLPKLTWFSRPDGTAGHPLIDAFVSPSGIIQRMNSEFLLPKQMHRIAERFGNRLRPYMHQLNQRRSFTPLSFQEVVRGLPGILSPLDLSRSCGSVSVGPSGCAKDRHISQDEDYELVYLEEAFESACACLERGGTLDEALNVKDRLFKATLKDEKRVAGKAARVFYSAPLLLTLVCRKYLWFVPGVAQMDPVETWLGLGLVPSSDKWDQAFRNYMQGSTGMDYSKFDQCVKSAHWQFLLPVFEPALEMATAAHKNAAVSLLNLSGRNLALIGSDAIEVRGIVCSGIFGTTIFDDVFNMLHVACALGRVTQGHWDFDPDQAFAMLESLNPIFFGDDFLSRPFNDLDGWPEDGYKQLVSAMAEMGFTVSSPSDKKLPPTFTEFEDSSFLSRSPKVYGNHIYGALDKTSIEAVWCYRHKHISGRVSTEKDHFLSTYLFLLSEGSLHEEEYFESVRDRVLKAAQELCVDVSKDLALSQETWRGRIRSNPEEFSISGTLKVQEFTPESGYGMMNELQYGGAMPPIPHFPQPTMPYSSGQQGPGGPISNLINGVVAPASGLASMFGLSKPQEPPVRDVFGTYIGGRLTNTDTPSTAFPLGAHQNCSVNKDDPDEISPTIERLGEMPVIILDGVWDGAKGINAGIGEPLLLTPGVISSTSNSDVMPSTCACLPFAYWRADFVDIEIHVACAPFFSGRLRGYMLATGNLASLDIMSADGSPLVPYLFEMDISKTNFVKISLPWQSIVPYLKFGLSNLGSTTNEKFLENTVMGVLSIRVGQPLLSSGPGEPVAQVYVSMSFRGLKVAGRQNDYLDNIAWAPQSGEMATPNQVALEETTPVVAPAMLTRTMLDVIPEGDDLVTESRLARFVMLFAGSWVGDTPFSFELPDALLESDLYQRMLAYSTLLQMDMKVRLTVTGPPTVAGFGVLSAVPFGQSYGTSFPKYINSPTRATWFPHAKVFAGGRRVYEMILPFIGSFSSYPVGYPNQTPATMRLVREVIGYTVSFSSFFGPVNSSGGGSDVNLYLEVMPVNIKLRVPTPTLVFVPEMEQNEAMAETPSLDVGYGLANPPTEQEGVEIAPLLASGIDANKQEWHELYFGENVTSPMELLHGADFTLTNSASTSISTTGGFVRTSVTQRFWLYPEDQRLIMWTFFRNMFTMCRGGADYTFFSDSTTEVFDTNQAVLVKPSFDIATLEPLLDKNLAAIELEGSSDTGTTLAQAKQMYQGSMIIAPERARNVTVNIPYYLPLNWVFLAPTNVLSATRLIASPGIMLRKTGITPTPMSTTTTTLNVRQMRDLVGYSVADDFRFCAPRPPIGMFFTSLPTMRTERMEPFYTGTGG